MGNVGGCNATNNEATCNAPLSVNMFEKYQQNEIDQLILKNKTTLAVLEKYWQNAVNAKVNMLELSNINCCQNLVIGNITAVGGSIPLNDVGNRCSLNN